MKNFLRPFSTSLGIAVVAAALASSANAGCGPALEASAHANPGKSMFMDAAYRPPHFVLADNNHDADEEDVVGMWNVLFTSPDGKTVIDFGYQQWHSDGTEIMNSGGHDPATQNFCMGVWAKAGNRGYKLNHYALSYNKTTGVLAVVVNIREQVSVSSNGNSFSGTFTMGVYPYDPVTGKTATSPVQSIAGVVSGTRVTVN